MVIRLIMENVQELQAFEMSNNMGAYKSFQSIKSRALAIGGFSVSYTC